MTDSCCGAGCETVNREEIEVLAYLKWEAAGCPEGRDEEFWLDAERDVQLKTALQRYPNISGTATETISQEDRNRFSTPLARDEQKLQRSSPSGRYA